MFFCFRLPNSRIKDRRYNAKSIDLTLVIYYLRINIVGDHFIIIYFGPNYVVVLNSVY